MVLQDFLQWMEVASPAQRAAAVRTISLAYLDPDVDAEARSVIEAALTVTLDDPAIEVRHAIADILGASPKAPRHVIISLAADATDTAILVLARSPVFIDSELAEIAANTSIHMQIAIARRRVLSSAVSAALAEAGEKAAVAALLENGGATIARMSFRRIAERFGGDSEIRDAMFGRPDLPPDVRQLLVRAVGDALGGMAITRAWVPEGRARTFTRDACDRATVAIAAESQTEDLPALVEHLRATEQLTTALLLRAVCAGNVAFFEAALAALSRIPEQRIAHLVRAGRAAALRAVYTKAGLPGVAFEAFAAALDTWRRLARDGEPKDRYRFTMEMVEAVLSRYSDITDGEANELAAMLRRFAADQARDAARDLARTAA